MKQFFKNMYTKFIIQNNLNFTSITYSDLSNISRYLKEFPSNNINMERDSEYNIVINYKHLKIKLVWLEYKIYIKQYVIIVDNYENGPWDDDVLNCIKELKQLRKLSLIHEKNKLNKAYETAWKDYNEGKDR